MKDPFTSNQNFGFLTTRVSRLLVKRVNQIADAKDIDLPINELGILSDLHKQEGIQQQQLAESMIRNKSSITKMLERLERDDFIYKKPDQEDARVKRIYLTDKGREMKKLLTEVIPDVHKIAFQGLEKEERDKALKVLGKMYNNLLNFNLNNEQA